jgi:PhzF family phenazine biosynthesis protein
MTLPLHIVDAFTDKAFAGHPAAVVVLDAPRADDWLQAVAAEMNLSETAFLLPVAESEDGAWNLRWFTPKAEVDLCGHATLGSSHMLWETGRLAADQPALFDTRSGRLTAAKLADGSIQLDFPADPPNNALHPPELQRALGVRPMFVAKGRTDLLCELDSEHAVRNLSPHMPAIAQLQARGLIVTATSDGQPYDFVSRFFAPQVGIPEDPVTGSAHTLLGPYWAKRLNKTSFTAYQASPRGGEIRVEVVADRVQLAGYAVTTVRGELLA